MKYGLVYRIATESFKADHQELEYSVFLLSGNVGRYSRVVRAAFLHPVEKGFF